MFTIENHYSLKSKTQNVQIAKRKAEIIQNNLKLFATPLYK